MSLKHQAILYIFINHYVEILIQTYSKIYNRSLYAQKCLKKKFTFFSRSIRTIDLSLNELKLIAKSRSVKDYKNKSEEDLIKILSEPKPKINLSKKKMKEVKKDF